MLASAFICTPDEALPNKRLRRTMGRWLELETYIPCSALEPEASLSSRMRSSEKSVKIPHVPLLANTPLLTMMFCDRLMRRPARGAFEEFSPFRITYELSRT